MGRRSRYRSLKGKLLRGDSEEEGGEEVAAEEVAEVHEVVEAVVAVDEEVVAAVTETGTADRAVT